ncbi:MULTISPECIES: GlsB/YeaQ/YmgE family stress response membrane protein [Saccharothrix]|uniref:GlsB/YeaQ/YmgE family stress response membrane protein n=1 Tax=Saccharothrix yanglingensis TaxID=659496 RepID=A0ABU0X8Z4_9PSEU|nr:MULTISPECIES: GlsB/YeaQ/YmgE family stress response membrane protein [Saccharothrix]MDQ2588598.1 GlsB/YeaQ/YmgE family stress response membrane protein [Saccharothrix yanglingensis]MDU0289359.1 GlsB/YeaQ/YmgE family stress response membrane protein [Saccharothrix longispora]
MGIDSVIGGLIIGLVIGLLGKLVAPGKQAIPIWLTIVVGVVAAFLGTLVARAFGVEETPRVDWLELLFQVVISAVGVSLAAGFYGKTSRR